MRWIFEKIGKLINEIVAGVAIALILSALTSGWYLIKNNLSNLPLRSWIMPGVGILLVLVAFASVIAIWKRRNRLFRDRTTLFNHSERIEKLFVGRQTEIDLFNNVALSDISNKDKSVSNIKVIWFFGMGGLGKSWLLEKFISIGLDLKMPSASVSCDKDRQIAYILRNFAEQLDQQGAHLDKFKTDIATYSRIQANLQETALNSGGQLARIITSTVGEIGIPGVSSIAKAVGPESVGQLVDSIRSQMSEEDAKLYFEPQGKLTSSFVEDIKKVSQKKRVILIFDTFEQAAELESWVCELVDKLVLANVIVVIAGRNSPSIQWNDLLTYLQTIELKAMDENDALACLRGFQGEHPQQEVSTEDLKNIYRFSKGLPLALSLSMYVVKQYGMKGFEAQSQDVINSLLQKILREARSKDWGEALEFCSILRSFNEDTLAAVTNREVAKKAYKEIKSSFPVVRKGDNMLALHDSIRDWLGQELFARSPDTFDEYHKKAASYYAGLLGKLESQNQKFSQAWQNCTENFLYHKFQTVDSDSLELLKTAIEEAQLNYPENMSIFLDLASKSDRFISKYKKWITYFEARLNPIRSERIAVFKNFVNDLELGLFARTSLGITLFNKGEVDAAVNILWQNHKQSNSETEDHLAPVDKMVLMTSKRFLAIYLRITGDFSGTCELLEGTTLPRMQVELARAYYFLGRYSEAESMLKGCLSQFEKYSHPVRYSALAHRYLAHIYIHERRFEDARQASNRSYEYASSINDTYLKNLALCNIAFIDKDISSLQSITDDLLKQDTTRYERKSIISKYANQTGVLHLERGDIEPARHYFKEALKLSQDSFYLVGIVRAELGLIECDYKNGIFQDSVSKIQSLENRCISAGIWDYVARLRLLHGKIKIELAKQTITDQLVSKRHLEDAFSLFAETLKAALLFNRYMLDLCLDNIISLNQTEPALQKFELLKYLAKFWKLEEHDGIKLTEWEKRGRALEAGNGIPQVFVLEYLENNQ